MYTLLSKGDFNTDADVAIEWIKQQPGVNVLIGESPILKEHEFHIVRDDITGDELMVVSSEFKGTIPGDMLGDVN